MQKKPLIIFAAFIFTFATLAIGYASFGLVTTLVFTSGFLGGFILWLLFPMAASFSAIKVPYWITLALFLVHRIEEYVTEFQQSLSNITGVPVPKVTSLPVILLLLVSVGAWLLVPFLVSRRSTFGYYLAWTFFAAMGISELAHFIFPFFTQEPYGYFPGMASVILLAPAAWWGMTRLARKSPIAAQR